VRGGRGGGAIRGSPATFSVAAKDAVVTTVLVGAGVAKAFATVRNGLNTAGLVSVAGGATVGSTVG
jgi:hypothetical protein